MKRIKFNLFFITLLFFFLITNTSAQNSTCLDSDGGDNLYVKGSVTNALGVTTEDLCVDSTILNEHSCPSQDLSQSGTQISAYNCPNGCNDGVCLSATNTVISDYNLKSNLLKNDPVAASILNGNNYTFIDADFYINNNLDINVSSFNFKLINILKRLGYSKLNPYSFLNQFQTVHNLSLSNNLDKNTLILIDSELFLVESKDNFDSARYAPLEVFIDSPENEPPKEHLAALYYRFFQALPSNMPYDSFGVARTLDEFRTSLVFGMGGNLGEMMNSEENKILDLSEKILAVNNQEDFRFCSTAYYSGFNKEPYMGDCINPPQILKSWWPSTDYEYILTFAHEFGHGIGSVKITFNETEDRIDEHFGRISYVRDSSDSDVSAIRENNFGEFISDYAETNLESDYGKKYAPQEDFAESFKFYLLQGKLFREKAKKNIYLQQKYDFLKNYVFKGIGYNTGDIDGYTLWISQYPNATDEEEIHSNDSPFGGVIGRENWIWDGTYPIYMSNAEMSENYSPTNDITLDSTEGDNLLCSGCILNNQCYPLGYRKSGEYCSETKEFVTQIESGSCDNDFECSSNLCVSDECVGRSFWQKILDFFRNLFGG